MKNSMQHIPTIIVNQRHRGFTLVEILIVVVILGILAAIVVPQFTSAAGETRTNSLKMDLHRIRTQLEVYKEQHLQQYPSLANIEAQLTMSTDEDGNTAAKGTPGYPFGPYLLQFPKNPNTGSKTISAGAVGASDWYYEEANGNLRANDTDISRLF